MEKHIQIPVKLTKKELTFLYRLIGHHFVSRNSDDCRMLEGLFEQFDQLAIRFNCVDQTPLKLKARQIPKGDHNSDRMMIDIE